MKKMLINATNEQEIRVALVDSNKVYDFAIEAASDSQTKNNIYLGKITRIEPSLEAAFVQYSVRKEIRHGFLSFKEIAPSCYLKNRPDYQESNSDPDSEEDNRHPISEIIKEGQEILVQVEKEERGTKGAALTTYITLAGSYLVLMPNNANAGGISRRIEGQERAHLKEALDTLEIPESMGLIVRTAGIGKAAEELAQDFNQLLNLWAAIDKACQNEIDEAKQNNKAISPRLIYQETNLILRAVRDYLKPEISEIIIDSEKPYHDAKEYIENIRPDFGNKIRLFKESTPLFTHYQIENQIETAFQREIRLPSGGAVVIDQTEALTAIDINSAKSTSGSNVEETALKTNLEAAHAIATQMRLRDAGGLFVIDFIDMKNAENRKAVENKMTEVTRQDRARIQHSSISAFGMYEMSRQRLRPSLGDTTQSVCPRCNGQGMIRSVPSLTQNILRLVEENATKENTAEVNVQVPVEVASFLLNEHRSKINELEQSQGVTVRVIPNQHLETPLYILERSRTQTKGGQKKASYNMVSKPKANTGNKKPKGNQARKLETPAVTEVPNEQLVKFKKKQKSLLESIINALFGEPKTQRKPEPKNRNQNRNRRNNNKQQGNRNRRPQNRSNNKKK